MAARVSTVKQHAATMRRPAFNFKLNWRRLAASALAGAFGVGAIAAHFATAPPPVVFGLLMATAIASWTGELLPDFAVALGLVVAWLLLGVSTPAQALAGFASFGCSCWPYWRSPAQWHGRA
jgi:hypothetical protein